jgi:hypothetical protein
MPPFNIMRRFSRSGSIHEKEKSSSSARSPPTSYTPPLSHATMMPNGASGSHHDIGHSRPASANTNSSFDFANRPPTTSYPTMTTLPSNTVGNFSRTDQIVLRHFWEVKYEENKNRDLHFVCAQPQLMTETDQHALAQVSVFPTISWTQRPDALL